MTEKSMSRFSYLGPDDENGNATMLQPGQKMVKCPDCGTMIVAGSRCPNCGYQAKGGKKSDGIKRSGSYEGHSNKPGMGGRSRQLEANLEKKGESKREAGAVAGMIARKKGEAPGQPGFHRGKK